MTGAVFLSASIPDPGKPHFVGSSDAIDVVSAVRALVYVVLGRRRLVWGGHPAITPIVWSVAASLDVDYGKWVTLYQSKFFKDRYPEDNERFANTRYTRAADPKPGMTEEERRNASLEHMRRRMFAENDFETAVFIGGMGGILEEFDLFGELCSGAWRVPLLSTGGAARQLAERLTPGEHNLDVERLLSDIDYVPMLYELCRIDPSQPRASAT